MKARNRPPRLDDRPPPPIASGRSAPRVPTIEAALLRSKAAGKVTNPGPRELGHIVDRLDVSGVEAWAIMRAVFGATPEAPQVDPEQTVRSARVAAARVRAVAASGARIACATAHPASWLPLHCSIARAARAAGGEIADEDDAGPMRVDGRAPRWIRWLDGVASVTDGVALFGTTGPEAAEEWMFLSGRPALVVADGPFAAAALAAGIEVIALAGLDRVDVAVAAAHAPSSLVVPLHPGRPARAYAPLGAIFEATGSGIVDPGG